MTSEAASYLSEYFCRKTDQQEALVDEELSEENINEAQEVLWRVCRGIEPIAALSRIEKDEYDVEAIEPLSGWRALHLAVGISGNAAIATMLLVEMGADPNSRSTESTGLRSPLHVAAACGHYQSCDVLLKHNARSGARTTDGRTALHLAAESDSFETLKLMVRASKEIDPRDDMGRTPLHLACANQVASVDAVQLLLQRGAQPDAVDAQGRIPLDILKKVVQKSAIIRTIAKLLGGTLDESQSDLLENKSDDKEKQIWILITKENTPKMLETSERKVALFISARSALDWYQKQMLNMKKPPMIPARVTNIHKLQSQVPTERIFYQEEDDDDDDPHMTDFVRKTKAEKQAEEETSKIRYIVQQKQQKLQLLKTQIAETSRKAKTCNAKSISLNDECQKLEELVTSLHTELRSSKLGSQIVDAALDLAATGHPAAVTNDPQRLATAAAHHLAYKRRLAILLSQADAAVAAAKLADAKLEAELQAKKLLELQHQEEQRQLQAQQEALAQKQDMQQQSTISIATSKKETISEPRVEVLDDSDDSSSEDDTFNLQELETQLKAAGVRKHAKVARHLNDQELSWTQMLAVYRKGGSDAIHRTLLPLGLKAGAISSIDLHLSACISEQRQQTTPSFNIIADDNEEEEEEEDKLDRAKETDDGVTTHDHN